MAFPWHDGFSIAGRIFASFISMNEQTVVGYGMVADKRISIGDRLRYIPMGYFNKNNIGTITGIVTTTLGDVEGAAPVALVNIIGGFFNSAVLILFLLFFNWQLGIVAFYRCVFLSACYRGGNQKIYRCFGKASACTEELSGGGAGIHSGNGNRKVIWF